MERKFEQELEKLNQRLIEISRLTKNQVDQAMDALLVCDNQLARNIIANDDEIDNLDIKIDKLCQRIFALQQPVATDLRFIMSALKINNEMERIGDIAVYIAKRIEPVSEHKEILEAVKLEEVVVRTKKVVKDALVIVESRQTALVKEIFDSANELKQVCRDIALMVYNQIMKNYETVVAATNLLHILGQVERIAAYCKNVAEAVYFVVEGKIVKHSQNF